jgi:hypothetical protein
MSAIEILVLIGGLGLGYFVVSRLYDELFGKRRPPAPDQRADQSVPGADRDSTDRRNP